MATASVIPQSTGTEAGDIAAGLITNGAYNTNIPATQITPATPIVTAPTPTTPDYGAAVTAAKNTVDTTLSKITADTTALGNESTDRVNFENAAGVNTTSKQILDLKASLDALNNDAQAETVKTENQPILSSIAMGQASQIEKLRSIKAAGISAQIAALQGNVTLAEQQVDKQIAMKYDPIKAEIQALNTQLSANRDSLTEAQKEQADQIKAQNDIKLKQVEADAAKEKDWLTNKNQALANGVPIATANKAQQLYDAGKETEARALLSNYTGTKSNQVIGYDGNGQPIYKNPTDTSQKDQQKIITDFGKSVGGWNMTGTREQFIRQLQVEYPQINAQDIARKVYEVYPDGYDQ